MLKPAVISFYIQCIGNGQPIKVHWNIFTYFTLEKAETVGLYNLSRSHIKSAMIQTWLSDLPPWNTSSPGEVNDMFALQLFHYMQHLGACKEP